MVLFPLPDSPTSATISPGKTWKEISLTASISFGRKNPETGKLLLRFWTSSRGVLPKSGFFGLESNPFFRGPDADGSAPINF